MTSDEEIRNVAIIATGSEQMGRTIANCFKRTGANGATMVEDGQTLTDEIEFTEGMEIERGYISPYFVTEPVDTAAASAAAAPHGRPCHSHGPGRSLPQPWTRALPIIPGPTPFEATR